MRAETLTWIGGQSDFALPLPLLEALQNRCGGDGVGLIFHRLSSGSYGTQDVISTVSLGLEGGGMKKIDAVNKVRDLYADHGLNKLVLPAMFVLGAALNGWPKKDGDDPKGEAGVETPKTS